MDPQQDPQSSGLGVCVLGGISASFYKKRGDHRGYIDNPRLDRIYSTLYATAPYHVHYNGTCKVMEPDLFNKDLAAWVESFKRVPTCNFANFSGTGARKVASMVWEIASSFQPTQECGMPCDDMCVDLTESERDYGRFQVAKMRTEKD